MGSFQFSVFSFRYFRLPARRRRGMSLLEVLAAIGVLSIGMLGLAALLPIGRYTIGEATKADRSGDCGRAALRDVIVRRMLDSGNWTSKPTTPAFIIDPRGFAAKLGAFAGTTVPRISLTGVNADAVFIATDDLVVPMPEDAVDPGTKKPYPVGRPQNLDLKGSASPLDNAGSYSWFLSVVPVDNNPNCFLVSVVVCFKREVAAEAERAVVVNDFYDAGIGGGSVVLASNINDAAVSVKENDWVALCSADGLCRWYRVAAIGDDGTNLTLIGPDWTPAKGKDKLVALGQSVLGVYTTTVDLDTDPTWTN